MPRAAGSSSAAAIPSTSRSSRAWSPGSGSSYRAIRASSASSGSSSRNRTTRTDAQEESMLSLKHLTKVYRTTEVETTALRSVDLDIAAGEFVAIMGPSGCGKSTLLNIVGMLDSPSSGEYWFAGQNIAGWSEGQLSELRKNTLGFIFQSF